MSGRNYLQYLNDIISTLDQKIVSLEGALKRRDQSTTPFTDYSFQSLPTQATSAVVGGTNFGDRGLGRGFRAKTNG